MRNALFFMVVVALVVVSGCADELHSSISDIDIIENSDNVSNIIMEEDYSPLNYSQISCDSMYDCSPYQYCVNNSCVTRSCETDYDCRVGNKWHIYACGDNICKRICSSDSDCIGGKCDEWLSRGGGDNYWGYTVCRYNNTPTVAIDYPKIIINDTGNITENSISDDKILNVSIIDMVTVDDVHSLTYHWKNLWGITYDNHIEEIITPSGQIISSCSVPFDLKGITSDGKYLWVSTQDRLYKIDTSVCEDNDACNFENNCIIDSINISPIYPHGLTFDGNYFYILDQSTPAAIIKYNQNGLVATYFKAPYMMLGEITWDGKYFWIVAWDGFACAGLCTPPPNYFKIYKYDTNFNLLAESNSVDLPQGGSMGITTDGKNLWISDGHNDRIYKLNISMI